MKSRSPRIVRDLLPDAVPGLAERVTAGRLRQRWRSIVGAEIARRTSPLDLIDGCLSVAVDNSPWLHELTLRREELTAKIAQEFAAVRSVRFALGRVGDPSPRGPRERPPGRRPLTDVDRAAISEAVAVIGNDEVAGAARRLLTRAYEFPRPEASLR